jgi:uncharacterized protein HemY
MAAIRYQPELPEAFRELFRRTYVERQDAEDLVDLSDAADVLAEQKQPRLAARLYQRCVQLSPEDPALLLRLGELCVEAGCFRAALGYLERGAALDKDGALDFDRPLGDALLALRRPLEAAQALIRSIARKSSAPALGLLGQAYEQLGEPAQAADAYRKALRLAPEDARARTRLAALQAGVKA